MTTLRAAAQQVLNSYDAHEPMAVVMEALRTALAEPEQEPPPKMRLLPCCGYHDGRAVFWNRFNGVVQCHSCGQQYAPHPPQPVTLTDEEIYPLYSEPSSDKEMVEFARAVIAAYQRKQEGTA